MLRMMLEEKISRMMTDSPAMPRLGIPAYNWWNESLRGVTRAGLATVFSQAIGLAAMWDSDRMFRSGKRNIYQGLTFCTPDINLFRDPRRGRGMETYGEDPGRYLPAGADTLKALKAGTDLNCGKQHDRFARGLNRELAVRRAVVFSVTGTRVLYARGSDLAAHMPAFEVVPASALFTSAGNRVHGLNAEYFNSASFDGKAHRPAQLTYPSSGNVI
jgi:beta-glucosidase-like glycosyl hydrolase